MTIDEAIKHCEEKAEQLEGYAEPYRSMGNCEKCAEEHRQLAEWLKELKQLREQTKWIPVFERMPKDGQNVLFCDIDEDIMIGYHVKGEPDTHFAQDGSFEGMKNVKAWMPLPDPYKIERGE